jgi:FkbM family methyltransferase
MTWNRLRQMCRGAARRIVSAPLWLSTAAFRSESITALWDGMVVETPIGTGRLRFFAPTPILRWRAHTALEKEPETLRWLDQMDRDAVLWDIGANIGLFSLYAAASRQCTVLAFEPSAANFAVLTRNVQLNRLHQLVTAYCLALAGETSLGVLNLDSPAMGTAMTQFGRPGDRSPYSKTDTPLMHGMVGFTVDDFVTQFAPPLPTHIKLDVDGLEWPILRGATRTLSAPRLQSLMVELSLTQAGERDRAIAFLASCGLRFASQGAPQGDPSEQGANHLFVRG